MHLANCNIFSGKTCTQFLISIGPYIVIYSYSTTNKMHLLSQIRDLYLTIHNTHKRQTSMPAVGFEPTISTGERPQTYALDRAATGTCGFRISYPKYGI